MQTTQTPNTTNDQLQRQFMATQIHKTNHLLHLFLSLITAGLWLPVWLFMASNNQREARKAISGKPDYLDHVGKWLLRGLVGVVLFTVVFSFVYINFVG